MDQLAIDVPLFHGSWGKELKTSSSPEVDLHFLLEDYLQDYGIPPETVPPDFDKLDSLLHELHQGQSGDLLRSHLTDVIRKEWGYPLPTARHHQTPQDSDTLLRTKEAEELAEDTYEEVLSLPAMWAAQYSPSPPCGQPT